MNWKVYLKTNKHIKIEVTGMVDILVIVIHISIHNIMPETVSQASISELINNFETTIVFLPWIHFMCFS